MATATRYHFGNLLGRIGFAGIVFFTAKGLLWLSIPVLFAQWF